MFHRFPRRIVFRVSRFSRFSMVGFEFRGELRSRAQLEDLLLSFVYMYPDCIAADLSIMIAGRYGPVRVVLLFCGCIPLVSFVSRPLFCPTFCILLRGGTALLVLMFVSASCDPENRFGNPGASRVSCFPKCRNFL